LAIVRALLEAQGGTIEVESQVGLGTTFRFTLPKRENCHKTD
jgi:signal transduction histidine kinase